MKTIFNITLIFILLVGCDKDKSDKRKMIGTWRLENISSLNPYYDTVTFDKNKFTRENISYDYELKNSKLFLLENGDTVQSYCYEILSRNKVSLRCFGSFGGADYIILNRIK